MLCAATFGSLGSFTLLSGYFEAIMGAFVVPLVHIASFLGRGELVQRLFAVLAQMTRHERGIDSQNDDALEGSSVPGGATQMSIEPEQRHVSSNENVSCSTDVLSVISAISRATRLSRIRQLLIYRAKTSKSYSTWLWELLSWQTAGILFVP